MSSGGSAGPATPWEALLDAVRSAASYNRADMVPPAAVLWTDRDRWWEEVAPRLRGVLPLLTPGSHDPQTLTGPDIWLRAGRYAPRKASPPPS